MINKLLSLSLILLVQQLPAQEVPKFGKIPIEVLQMHIYEKDTSAEAVVLFDIGHTSFSYNQSKGWSLVFTRHTAIKIFDKSAYDRADRSVSTYHSGQNAENFTQLKAITYNVENDKVNISRLSKDAQFKEVTNEFWEAHKFSLPDVREGSVIEFQYKIISDFTFNLQPWTFQSSIPVIYSEYTTNIPEYYNYRKITQGYHPFSKNEESSRARTALLTDRSERSNNGSTTVKTSSVSYSDKTQVLAANEIPAMRDESFVSSLSNYVLKIEYELQSTNFPSVGFKDYRSSWQSLNKNFLESLTFGKQLDNNRFMAEDLQKAIVDVEDSVEMISAIFEMVRDKMSWNNYNSKYVTNTIRDAYIEGSGSAADINIILVAALRSKGFKADPVLISTRKNGLVRQNFPLSSQFNYVLARVQFQDTEYILDAVDKEIPFGFLPVRCLNGNGWAVNESGGQWVNLTPAATYEKKYMLRMSFDGEMLTGHVDSRKSAYAAFNDLAKLRMSGEEEFSKRYESNDENWQISSFSSESEPTTLVESIDLDVKNHSEVVGNMVLINPILFDAVESNPFKMEKRDYPIDFTYPRKISYLLSLEIPEDMKVEEIPQSLNLALPEGGGRFIYSAQVIGNKISISTQIQLSKPSYQAEFYPYLKQFYKSIVDKHAEQIVLTRI